MEQNILEGNILIAQFMGWELHKKYLLNPDNSAQMLRDDELSYHSNWASLMSVVEKIETMSINFIIDNSMCYWYREGKIMESICSVKPTKIESVWSSVIRFIQWYNQNNNNETGA